MPQFMPLPHTMISVTVCTYHDLLQDAGSWVVAPSPDRPVKGVVHFLGGAFAGAAPQVTPCWFNFWPMHHVHAQQ